MRQQRPPDPLVLAVWVHGHVIDQNVVARADEHDQADDCVALGDENLTPPDARRVVVIHRTRATTNPRYVHAVGALDDLRDPGEVSRARYADRVRAGHLPSPNSAPRHERPRADALD